MGGIDVRDILAEIVEKKKGIVADAKRQMPLDEVKRALVCGNFEMAHRFRERKWNLIAECKLQSPAKGRLCRRYSVTELAHIARAYLRGQWCEHALRAYGPAFPRLQ